MDIAPVRDWLPHPKKPLVIAGPCSAESREQVLATARQCQATGRVHLFRAGIWKPRTKPNSFEGYGAEALPWLALAREETGLLTTTEVATAAHAELALKHNVDVLWIGARTAANPFAVQEIADFLRGAANVAVLVKNPINADLALWEGALERIAGAGITRLGAVHRGFSVYQATEYRNDPLWRIPIDLKRKYPQLPLLCDPSHIAGDRSLVEKVAQKAMDLDFDGLMIETHVDPEHAMSDAAQQVTPSRLNEILRAISIRSEFSADSAIEHELHELRGKIDRIDQELIELLRQRMDVVERIGETKIRANVTALQVHRAAELMQARIASAELLKLRGDYVREIFTTIHAESALVQTEMMNGATPPSPQRREPD